MLLRCRHHREPFSGWSTAQPWAGCWKSPPARRRLRFRL